MTNLKNEMPTQDKLMAVGYCGLSSLIALSHILNEDGFKFIGVDKQGDKHYCIVRCNEEGLFYMSSNTALFSDLIGFLPDIEAPSNTAIK